ncbi:hemerythrin domain-containing protein [Ideonella sp. A 288]|uniref:hemerythrin domain-containing protein n=1 Tax=Ideonella sp. A 288 TaxID=1962181 RepID=UPI000B4C05E8|nr:hemerythrin domain-containing protein [Ideonella sp. A 288]
MSIPIRADNDNPIDDFSNCHVGIVAQLNEMARLPGLLEPAALARKIAGDTVRFFREAVYEHHAEEERELFPAVLASSQKGDERDTVQAIVDQLVREHRQVEAAWELLEPALKAVAKGQDADVDVVALDALVIRYQAHAAFEERHFLPLSQTILGRNSNHLAALGVSMHMRHVMPDVMKRFGHRI